MPVIQEMAAGRAPVTADLGLDHAMIPAEAGAVAPVIDRIYTLDAIGDAMGHIGERQTRGKTVIRLRGEGPR